MVKQENPNFIASKYAPNPKEVSYWIDLATDSTGNVIKSYSPDLKKWIPLNRDANVDQWTHIKEIVQSVGLNYDKNSDIISLPDNSSNNYFKGTSIVDAINKGDAAVKAQVDRLDTKIDDVNEDLQDFKALKGQPNGLAELDGNGKVPASQLPSYVDDVMDAYATYTVSPTGVLQDIQLYADAEHETPIVGERDKIYVNVTPGEVSYQFRWSGSQWVHIDSNAIIIGDITGTAYDGGKGKAMENVVGSMPDNLLSTFQLDQTDVNNITISLTGVEKSGGKYVQSTLADITITPATNTVAGLMTGAEKLAINETLPDAINDEKVARENAVKELKAKDTELQGNIDSLETALNQDITELRSTILKVNDKVGLTEANEMPDLSSTNYLTDSPSAISAAVTLDEEIGKLSRNENELWYGVKFDLANSSSPDGVRTGNMEMHKTLPIQSKMRGCTINNDDNTKRYLKADDWNKWEDGTTVTDDSNGRAPEIMVEMPEHYRLLVATPDNTVEIRMSEYNLPGYTKVEKKYIGAYEGVINTGSADTQNTLRSIAVSTLKLKPVVSNTRNQFQTFARGNNRTNNWNIYTYDAHRDLTWLFVVEYATLNSQKAFNANLTAEGYHQGGLGEGITTGTVTVNGATTYSFVHSGVTKSLGNGTGIIEYTHTNTNAEGSSTGTKTVNVPRYRGIENPFGHVWKNVIDVVVAGTDNSVYICKDYTKFGTFEGGTNPTAEQLIAAGYELQDFKESTITSQYVKKLVNNNQADLFPTVVGNGASSTTYYCDYHWTSAVATPRTLLIGGGSADGSYAGLFSLSSRNGLDSSSANVGTRITFYGEPALPAAPATLELDDEDYEQIDSMESEENWF